MLHRLDVFALPMCRKQYIYYVRFADFETGIDIKSRSSVDACILWNPIQAQIQEGLVSSIHRFWLLLFQTVNEIKSGFVKWGRTVNKHQLIAFVHFQQLIERKGLRVKSKSCDENKEIRL